MSQNVKSCSFQGVEYNLNDDNTWEIVKIDFDIEHLVIPPFVESRPVTSIRYRAARHHNKLISVTFPKTIKSIGIECFQSCHQLTEVYLTAEKVKIHRGAFCNCGKLQKVVGDSIYMDASGAFANCSRLETLRATCRNNIPSYAFENCKRLTEVTCGENVIIDDNAFRGCMSLEKFVLHGDAIVSHDMWHFMSKREIHCKTTSRFVEMAYSGTKVVYA